MSSSSPRQQIVIFSAQGCKYCEKAKLLLKEYNPTIFDVDVSPQRYQQAAAFTKCNTVPLIFVGNEFIGGCSELEAKKEHVFQKIINKNDEGNEQDDDDEALPHFLRLTLSDDEKQVQMKKNAKMDEEINFLEHNGYSELQIHFSNNTSFSYGEILEYLRFDPSTRIVLQDRGGIIFGKRPKTVTGKELFDACKKFVKYRVKISSSSTSGGGGDDDEESLLSTNAKEMLMKLVDRQMVYSAEETFTISPPSKYTNYGKLTSPSTLFRFAADACEVGDFSSFGKFVLNSDRNASTTTIIVNATNTKMMTGSQAVSLSRALWRSQNQLMSEFRDEKSGLVDYEGELRSKILENPFRVPSYAKFKQLASLLQFVDLSILTDAEKICFGINLYNTLVYIGFAECYVPWSTFQKISFFSQVGVFIGFVKNAEVPLFFSLNDIENGLLRGNRKGLTDIFGCPFSSSESSDPRFALPVKRVDYRIHFGLNCGAKSCPPVKLFSVENLHQELELAATAFIQSTSTFDRQKKVIATSQILKWYRVDFDSRLPHEEDECASKEIKPEQNVQSVVLKYLGINKDTLVTDNKKLEDLISVEFAEYDWSFDAKPKK